MNEYLKNSHVAEILQRLENNEYRYLLKSDFEIQKDFIQNLLDHIKPKVLKKKDLKKKYRRAVGKILVFMIRDKNRYRIIDRYKFRKLIEEDGPNFKMKIKNGLASPADAKVYFYKELMHISEPVSKTNKNKQMYDIMVLVYVILSHYDIIEQPLYTRDIDLYIRKNKKLENRVKFRDSVKPTIEYNLHRSNNN